MDGHTLLLITQQALLLLLLVCLERPVRMWSRQILRKRSTHGEHILVGEMRKDRDLFYRYFRMHPEQFDHLLSIVGPSISKMQTNWRKPIPIETRLAITLRYLATGDSQQTISFSFRVGHSTVCEILEETCEAIWKHLMPVYMKFPSTQEEWRTISENFYQKWNFPMCAGALDGKHVVIQAPPNAGSEYFNYKGQHSIVLLALCDADYCFNMIDVGDIGRHSDGGIFAQSEFGLRMLKNEVGFPPEDCLPGTTTTVPFCIVADAAFPLKPNIMRPYPGRCLTTDKKVFNYRLSRARRVIENTFGILAGRWRIFRRPIIACPDKVINITKAACCLHNFLQKDIDGIRSRSTGVERGDLSEQEEIRGTFQSLGRSGSNSYSRFASEVRERFREYFMSSEGQVSWQMGSINRH